MKPACLWCLAVLAVAAPSHAQQATNLRKTFDNCVYNNVFDQIEAGAATTGPAEAAERGFFACQTEERAMYAYLALSHLPPEQIEATIVQARRQVKAAVRQMFAAPKRK